MGIRESKKIETKKMLIVKAHKLFNELGVSNIGMRKLAEESGLGLGTYYNYFKTKDEIVFAISNTIFLNSFNKTAIKQSKFLDQSLNRLVISILKEMENESQVLYYLVQIISNPDHYIDENSEGRKFTEVHITKYFEILSKILPENLKSTDKKSFSRLCWHQLIIFLYMWFMDQSQTKTGTIKFIKNTHKTICYGII